MATGLFDAMPWLRPGRVTGWKPKRMEVDMEAGMGLRIDLDQQRAEPDLRFDPAAGRAGVRGVQGVVVPGAVGSGLSDD